MKKIYGFLAVAVLLLITGCGKKEDTISSKISQGQSDLEYVQEKGTLMVGVTDFMPMDYQDGGEWKGFDADLAKAFAESLHMSAEFTLINWDDRVELLEKGTIDCIWNGMTLTEEMEKKISCTDPYLSGAQVLVMPKEELEKYGSLEECQHFLFAVEEGSTGEDLVKEKKYRYTDYAMQKEALESVQEKEADAAVVDIMIAACDTGEGKEFEDLGFSLSLNNEKIAVGFRKGSDLTEKANQFLKDSYADGTMESLAETYGLKETLLQ